MLRFRISQHIQLCRQEQVLHENHLNSNYILLPAGLSILPPFQTSFFLVFFKRLFTSYVRCNILGQMAKKAVKKTKTGTSSFDSVKYRNDFIRINYDRITLAVKKGKKEKWTAAAKAQALSLSEYITRKVDGIL